VYTKVVILILISFHSFASLDLSIGSALRTYPSLGAQFELESGYNMLLWGQGKKASPFYGLFRPNIKLATSAVVNQYDANLSFYPISFIGLEFGHRNIRSDFEDFPFYNCELVTCVGNIKSDYTGFKMALAYAGIIAMGKTRIYKSTYTQKDSKQFTEFRYGALANAPEDQNIHTNYFLGYKINNNTLGIMHDYTRFSQSKQKYEMNLAVIMMKNKSSSYTFGAGNFRSTHQKAGAIFVFRYQLEIWPSEKLF
jgi:hypothetical protein